MRVDIVGRSLSLSDSHREYIHRRIEFAFARSAHSINVIAVMLTDVNGPKGGVDVQCKLVISIPGLDHLVVSDTQTDIHQAVDSAVARASQSLIKRVKRRNLRNQRQGKQRRRMGAAAELFDWGPDASVLQTDRRGQDIFNMS